MYDTYIKLNFKLATYQNVDPLLRPCVSPTTRRYYSSCQVPRKNAKLAAVKEKGESMEDMDGEREGCSADGAGEGSGAGGGAFSPQYGVELSKETTSSVAETEGLSKGSTF